MSLGVKSGGQTPRPDLYFANEHVTTPKVLLQAGSIG